jgi:hypothetical protein
MDLPKSKRCEEFYLFLNSSKQDDNGNISFKLDAITLNDQWQVALTDVYYPRTILHETRRDPMRMFICAKEEHTAEFQDTLTEITSQKYGTVYKKFDRDYFKDYPNAAIISVCIGDNIASTPVGEFNLDNYILVVNRQMKYPWIVMSERDGLCIKKDSGNVRVQWTWYKKYPEKVIVFPILSTGGARLIGLPDVLSPSFKRLVKNLKYGGDILVPKDGFYMGRANIIVCSNLVQHNGPSSNRHICDTMVEPDGHILNIISQTPHLGKEHGTAIHHSIPKEERKYMPIARKMVDDVTIRTVADEELRPMRFPRATYVLHFKPLFPDACIAIQHESEESIREKNQRQSENTLIKEVVYTARSENNLNPQYTIKEDDD